MTAPLHDTAAEAVPTAPVDPAGPGAKKVEGRSLKQIAWSRLKQDKVALAGGITVVVLVLIAVFATALRWLPPVSTGSPAGLVLPTLTLAIPLAGFLGQVMRRSLLDALESPFVLAARARGEGEIGVRSLHALRHAVLPGVSLSGCGVVCHLARLHRR